MLGARPGSLGCRPWGRFFGDPRQVLVSNALARLSLYKQNFSFCREVNISICPASQTSEHFRVIIYNPVGRKVDLMVRLPVSEGIFLVKDPNYRRISSNVVMVPSAYSKTYQWELLFPASVPALGFSIYSVNKMSGHNHQAHNLTARPKKSKSRVLVIENKVRLLLDPLPCLRDKFKVL